MARLLALDDLPLLPETLAALKAIADGGRLDADDPEVVLLATGTPLTAERLAAWPSLRHVALCGTSTARIDLDAVAAAGATWSNVTHYGDDPVAEVALAHLVALARGIGQQRWREHPHELAGMSMVIVGMGHLGRSLLPLMQAVGLQVSYVSRTPKPELDARGVHHGTRDELLPRADIVVLTGPTDTEVLSAADFDLLLDGVIVVQASIGRAMSAEGFDAWIVRPGNFALFDAVAGDDQRRSWAHLPRVRFTDEPAGMSYEARQRLGAAVVADVRRALGLPEDA